MSPLRRTRYLFGWVFGVLLAVAAPSPAGQPQRDELRLDGPWRFQPAITLDSPPKSNQWAQLDVPGGYRGWEILPGRSRLAWKKDGNVRSCWYEREVVIPQHWLTRRVVLALDEIDLDAVVFVDGRKVGEVLRPEGLLDVTQSMAPGGHLLRIYVTADYAGVSRGLEQDLWMEGQRAEYVRQWCHNDPRKFQPGRLGLSGSVTLRAEPFTAIQDVLVRTSVRKGELALRLWVHSRDGMTGGRFQIRVLEKSVDREVFNASCTAGDLSKGTSAVSVSVPWKAPILWQIGAPHLYRAVLTLLDRSDQAIDRFGPVTFGFREVWTEGRQLLVNGKPFHLRAPWNHPADVVPNWPFWQGLGCNGLEIQPNPTAWCGWGGRPIFNPQTLESADQLGMALLAPAPRASPLAFRFPEPRALAAYERELQLWVRRYGNHPSILGWLADMNRGNPTEFMPENIGRPFTADEQRRARVWLSTVDIAHAVDPTRLVGFHSGGRPGDFQTGNVYLNFVPLQECEEWLSAWAAQGNKPFGAVEFGNPLSLDFFKQKVPLYSEYSAIYFGDQAYRDEDDEYVKYIAARLANDVDATFSPRQLDIPIHHTSYLRLESLFLRNMIRSWRTWGLNLGMHFWLFQEGFGRLDDMDAQHGSRYYNWYRAGGEELRSRPFWANALYDAVGENHQDLLVYLGGQAERFTAKDHAFRAGQPIEKTVVAIWDGNQEKNLDVRWRLDLQSRREPAVRGSLRLVLQPGAIVKQPFLVVAPAVTAKTAARLTIETYENGSFLGRDSLAMQLYPREGENRPCRRRWLLYDPASDSSGVLTALGIKPLAYRRGQPLGPGDVLVIGRNALRGLQDPLFDAAAVARGLRVLVLEQHWEGLEGLGLRCEDLSSRYVFIRAAQHPALEGIGPEELANWSGESTLLAPGPGSERKRIWPHAPHWGQYGNVATVLPETPHAGAFLPIVEAEFDLQYSPLLEWRHGRGTIVFCQLDVTGRVPQFPPAARIAGNLARYLDRGALPPQDRHIAYVGGDEDWGTVQALGFSAERTPTAPFPTALAGDSVIVVGKGGLPQIKGAMERVQAFVRQGGTVFLLPQTNGDLGGENLPFALPVASVKASRTALDEKTCPAVFCRLGPHRLTWRAMLPFTAIGRRGLPDGTWRDGQGLLVTIPDGRGQWVFCQVDWRPFEDRQTKNHLRTRGRVRQIYVQILTNLGVATADCLAARLTTPRRYAALSPIPTWNTIGPFAATKPGAAALDTILPVEAHPVPPGPIALGEGRAARWRPLTAHTDDKVWLSWFYPPGPRAVACAVSYVYSARERSALVRLRCEGFLELKVNGSTIARLHDESPGGSRRVLVRARLRPGWNELFAKVATDGKGLSFGCCLSDPGDMRVDPGPRPPRDPPADLPPAISLLPDPPDRESASLYLEPMEAEDDPYGFTPW